jgi:head-tail adaptor
MGFSSGFLHEIIRPLNRKDAKVGKYGIDSAGIEWEEGPCLHANVDYQRGKRGLGAGSIDVYAVKIVRMRWTNQVNMRSRVEYDGQTYQIIPETFNEDKQGNSLQFLMQLIVNNDKNTPSNNAISGGDSSHEIGG